jgi:hypothetical protein
MKAVARALDEMNHQQRSANPQDKTTPEGQRDDRNRHPFETTAPNNSRCNRNLGSCRTQGRGCSGYSFI